MLKKELIDRCNRNGTWEVQESEWHFSRTCPGYIVDWMLTAW